MNRPVRSSGSDVELWRLVASAVAGRPLQVVRTEAADTYTDGDVVHLAADATIDSLVVQAGLIAIGSLEQTIVSRLVGRPASRSRYLTLEACRAAHELRGVAPAAVTRRILDVNGGRSSQSAEESLRRASDAGIPRAPQWFGAIRPTKLLRVDGAGQARAEVEGPEEIVKRPDDALDDPEQERLEDMSASSFTTSLTSKLASALGMGRASRESAGGGGGQELATVGARVGRPSRNARRVDPPGWLKLHAGADRPFGRLYPEWSVSAGGYLDQHCAVAEFDPLTGDDATPLATRRDPQLRRQLARLGLANQVYRRQADGDVLDLSALVDYAIDREAGTARDARVYEERKRTAHDLGVLVLLDATGSTSQSTDGMQVFAAQRELAGRLTATLEELGDRVATFGFHSSGRYDVRFFRVKRFDDRFDRTARRRLGALAPAGFTRLGAAVRHGTHLLLHEAGTSRMLLVIVGDGLPYEHGYEDRHAQEDTRRALSEAVARGVGCACVSMRSTTDADIVERVWGHVAHRRLDAPDELARHVRPLFRNALREAAASRRPQGET